MRPPKITSVRPFTGLYPFGTRHHIFGAGLFAARVWTVTEETSVASTRKVAVQYTSASIDNRFRIIAFESFRLSFRM